MSVVNLASWVAAEDVRRADEEDDARRQTDLLLPRGELEERSSCCNARMEYRPGVVVCTVCRVEYYVDVLS